MTAHYTFEYNRKSFLQSTNSHINTGICWHLSYVTTCVNKIGKWELRVTFCRAKTLFHSHLGRRFLAAAWTKRQLLRSQILYLNAFSSFLKLSDFLYNLLFPLFLVDIFKPFSHTSYDCDVVSKCIAACTAISIDIERALCNCSQHLVSNKVEKTISWSPLRYLRLD